jgi:SAM-dependent methyltransferase
MFNEDELNQIRIFNTWAKKDYLQSTIDPNDDKGLKCDYINNWSRYYIKKFVLGHLNDEKINVLEIGCGSGRNLFALAPYIGHGYGIDIADEQIKNAKRIQSQFKIENLTFHTKPESFFTSSAIVQTVFTMWVLAGFQNDQNLIDMLSKYIKMLTKADRFIFFEQVANKTYIVEEKGHFFKKVRSQGDFSIILSSVGLRIREFKIINEKGFGPLYRLIYLSRLYRYWPKWLNMNKFLFAIDRHMVKRDVSHTFTDSVFVCEKNIE